jgi:hypothetical protein
VTAALAELSRQRGGESGLGRRVEACLLDEILSRIPADVPVAAALLGVSQPTLARRAVRYRLSGGMPGASGTAQARAVPEKRRADLSNSPISGGDLRRKN